MPSEEVPSELPEPVLGINYARDGMTVMICGSLNVDCLRCLDEGVVVVGGDLFGFVVDFFGVLLRCQNVQRGTVRSHSHSIP